MGRSISIDLEIKEHYRQFINDDHYQTINVDSICEFVEQTAKDYIKKIYSKLHKAFQNKTVTIDKITEHIVADAMYHIYENISFLDARYNIDIYIQEQKRNKEVDVEDTVEILSLFDHLHNKNFEKNHMRRYKYSITHATHHFIYEQKFKIPNTCPVFINYYSIYNPKDGKNYLWKPYLDIIDFFHTDRLKKSDVKFKLKSYTIWDIDQTWLSTIAELYESVKNGRNNVFQFQLLERMFKFRTLNFIAAWNKENGKEICYYIQPFTQLGYSSCMIYYIENFKGISALDCEEELAEVLFNGITYTIKTVLKSILGTLLDKRTNKEKQRYIRDLKRQVSNIDLQKIKNYYDFWYTPVRDDDLIPLYKDILFNNQFQTSYERRVFDHIDINDFSDIDEEDEEIDSDTNYNGEIQNFYNSLCVEPITNIFDWNEVPDCSEPTIYEFDFADMLYLITELEYKDYYSG